VNSALFASLSGVDPGVFESQVLDYGCFMRSLGIDFRYLLFEGLRSWITSRRQLEATLEGHRMRYGAQIEMEYLLRPWSPRGLRRAAARIASHAAQARRAGHPLLVQARGVPAAWAALEAKRRFPSAKVLYDARDDPAAEARMEARHHERPGERRRWEARAAFLEELEARVCRESDHVLAVSGPLADRVRRLGGRPEESVTVVPCCLDPGRFLGTSGWRQVMRKELGLEGRPVLVYSGSLSVWQLPDRVAALAEGLRKLLPDFCLLLLTPHREEAERHFGYLEREGSCKLLSRPHGEIGRCLAAADAALLLREEDPVNRVACPVKFAEYQACGLPVILTPGIGDISDYVLRTGYGRVVNLEEEASRQAEGIAELMKDPKWGSMREEIGRNALRVYARESYRDSYRAALERLGLGGEAAGSPGTRRPARAGAVP
jgi:glycosyltransferase involved in cell wall biosynthesis